MVQGSTEVGDTHVHIRTDCDSDNIHYRYGTSLLRDTDVGQQWRHRHHLAVDEQNPQGFDALRVRATVCLVTRR